ncbi:hypothetical protein P691DRAFT_414092 [Macrolepiota fuliginosa MF-IS2]|uniref:Uncharacterized protein n=1 Tax=Macrolepiota fuliginosa MF-IS2 TaxID=1400762 RepID=A0A9P6BZB8_9AGAR|nr:hypothetical protein P691DRAFT_414092 [Macrolepiota fuliginosa MF-IS2]
MGLELQLDDKLHLAGSGASFALYCINFYFLVRLVIGIYSQGRERLAAKSKLWRHLATFLSFVLASNYLCLQIYVTYLGLAEHRDSKNGSAPWIDNSKRIKGVWLAIAVSGLGCTWAIDASVLYQCFVLYSVRGNISWILLLPATFLLSSLGTGAYLLSSSLSSLRILPHFPICITTKLLSSSLIILKLIQQRKKLTLEFGNANLTELARPYTFLIHIFVQSYALYSIFSVTFLVLFVSNNSAWRVFLPCLSQIGLMSQLLIQIRVLRNRTRNISIREGEEKPVSPIVFITPSGIA